MQYPSGHRLHVGLTVDVAPGYPLWIDYRFHLQDRDGWCVFRYDNAPHHAEFETFPHHQHVGPDEEAREQPLPTLRQIIREIGRYLDG